MWHSNITRIRPEFTVDVMLLVEGRAMSSIYSFLDWLPTPLI